MLELVTKETFDNFYENSLVNGDIVRPPSFNMNKDQVVYKNKKGKVIALWQLSFEGKVEYYLDTSLIS